MLMMLMVMKVLRGVQGKPTDNDDGGDDDDSITTHRQYYSDIDD